MLISILDRQVRTAADRPAIAGTDRLSYAQLGERERRFAAALAGFVAQDDCVATLLPNGSDFVAALFATARLGTSFLPLNPVLTPHEIARHLTECQARAVLVDRERAVICRDSLAHSQHGSRILLVEDLRDAMSAAAAPERAVDADAPFLIQFTSGSTGRLKQVRRTRRQLAEEARNFWTSTAVRREDKVLCIVPMHHAHGLGNGVLAAIYAGATLVVDRYDADGSSESRSERIVRLIERERVTICPGVPFIFEAMAQMPAGCAADLSSVRLCFSAGISLARSTFDRFRSRFGVPIRQLYGCTEAGSIAFNLEPDIEATWDSVGRPLGSVIVRIVDEGGNELPAGTEGDIEIRSPALCDGYVGAPDATRAAYRDGYFATGDRGRQDADGRISITGRKRRFIHVGGYKVDPGEIEDVLAAHPKVSEAVVVGISVGEHTELVKAVVVSRTACSSREILDYCRTRMADYKVPAICEFVSAIPKSPLGKILRAPLLETGVSVEHADIERHARQLVADLIGIDPSAIDRERPLAEYGLNSARAVEFALRLGELLGVALPPTLIWNHPTLAAIAVARVGSAAAPAADSHAVRDQWSEPAASGVPGRTASVDAIIGEIERLNDTDVRNLLLE